MGCDGGGGGAFSPSLSANGKAVSAGVDEGPPMDWPGFAGFALVVTMPGAALATDTGAAAGHPQGSGSLSTTCCRLPCSNITRWLGCTRYRPPSNWLVTVT